MSHCLCVMKRHFDLIVNALVLSLSVQYAHAHSTGADASACGNLTPSHTGSAQTSDSPFVVLLSKTTYTAGETVDVTLEGLCGEEFKGFLLQARRAEPTADQTELIGTFTSVAGTQTLCANTGDVTNRGLTHDNSTSKSSLTVQWTAPTPATGHIIFRATFVKSFSEYWVGVTSAVLTDPTAAALTVSADSLATPTVGPCTTSSGSDVTTAAAVGISRDEACGTSLGCFDDCNTGCTFSVSWAEDGDNIRFTLKAVASGNSWIGVGFSSDKLMGDDSVTECVVVNGVVRAFQSYNVGYSNSRLASPEDGVSDVSGTVVNGVFSCSFLRMTGGTGSQSFNLSLDWFLLAAQGSANADFSINKHTILPSPSSAVLDFQAFTVSGAESLEFVLVKAHGALMTVSWILFASVGLVIARFYKPMWPNKTLGGANLWFQIHRACMIGTLLFTVIAFILIFVEVGGYSQTFEVVNQNAHPVMGIIVTILVIINPLMAIFRPSPTSEKRPIFNWLHFLVGKVAYILAVVTTFLGFTMTKAKAPVYSLYILAAYCVWQMVTEMGLELVKWRGKNQEDERVADESNQDKQLKSNVSTINNIWLFLHIAVVLALSLALVGILATAQ